MVILKVVSAFSLAFLLSRSNIFKDLSSVNRPVGQPRCFRLRVQRYNLFLKPPNFFKVFFEKFFGVVRRCFVGRPPPIGPLPDRFVPESGCKSTASCLTLQTLSQLFLNYFITTLIIRRINLTQRTHKQHNGPISSETSPLRTVIYHYNTSNTDLAKSESVVSLAPIIKITSPASTFSFR